MKKYEYMTQNSETRLLTEEMNVVGQQGWKLVSVVYSEDFIWPFRYYFIKEIEEQE